MLNNKVDILENDIQHEVLVLLLRDHTTGHNIVWATHDYETLGEGYGYGDEITLELITGKNGKVISPRVKKSKEQQSDRVKDMAEVFTPSWVVKMMVDYLDIAIDTRCLELTCGEAPFLVSRYDATTGEPIAISERVGVLDRKLRLVNDQQLSDEDWLALVRRAFQSTYGYEWQGDSLLLARENLLYTFIDHYEARFGSKPDVPLLQDFAEIISWNLWQMDGLTYRTPREKSEEPPQAQLSFFDEAPAKALPPLCKIMDWQTGKIIKVNDIKKRQTKNQDIMKFDVIIGNPPYQEESVGDSNTKTPLYHYFINESYKLGKIVELISPARFLFNAGYTPKEWNNMMLKDPNLKVVKYYQNSTDVFPNQDIKGGIAITLHNKEKRYGALEVFTAYNELNTILAKVKNKTGFQSFSNIIVTSFAYHFTAKMHQENPDAKQKMSKGHENDVQSNIFDTLPELFHDSKPDDGSEYIRIFGLENRKNRCYKYIRKDYVNNVVNTDFFKLLLPKAVGDGKFGEVLTNPVIVSPKVGYTSTFISIGCFENQQQVEKCLKYIKTKFARTMLSVLKITQDNTPRKWAYVPLQDFTPSSDIDWSKSIAEIDEQLFDKYGLEEKEREFIRTKVKEMA